MKKIEKEILEAYSRDYKIEAISYEIMGRMLDTNYVGKRLKLFNISSMYIYGGTYMGIQLYRIGKEYVSIKGIVDKYGKIIDNSNISLFNLNEFKKRYKGEKVIITPIRFYDEIRTEIELCVKEENIISIGDLLLGIN